ncbi:MAG: hypothetical protein RIC84_25360 [Aggregatilineales bacterium]
MEQKLSVQILTYLCNLIMTSPYRTMRELTIFFKQFDVPDVYGNPSRTNYTEQQLIELNNQGKLISVIEQAVDPRNFFESEIDIEEIIAEANRFLALDDLLLIKARNGYKVKLLGNRHHSGQPIKNIIFGSTGPKPDIVLRDALTNQIEITQNAEHCLVYDHHINDEAGLSWDELVEWWMSLNQLKSRSDIIERELYQRLRKSIPETSPPARNLFHSYYSFKQQGIQRLPALLPEVYLHFDPKTIIERNGKKVLNRQRMDFLLLLPYDVRIVIEVDGKHHYADGDIASPERYGEMMMEDRELRLMGYEVYRFGAVELNKSIAESNVKSFFRRIFKKYGIL